ncbi:hypothetical protein HDU96_010338 [Phlyctochytrium bullatum]|nr:hypothetical protein HDU96_010338 [Phlyctochytrium bullatum]
MPDKDGWFRDEVAKVSTDLARFEQADFFAWPAPSAFDIVFDHTFLCALEKNMRAGWAKRMAELVRPGGYLIAYMYPLAPESDAGPPFTLSVEVYQHLLTPQFEEVYIRELLPEEAVPKGRSFKADEKMSLWKRKA